MRQELAQPLISRKKVFIGVAIGSVLMSVGFLAKSGLLTQSAGAVRTWYETQAARSGAAAAADTQRQNQEGALREKLETLHRLPADDRPPLVFRGQQKTLTAEIRSDQWSRKIIIPDRKLWWRLKVSPPEGFFIVFEDGFVDEVKPADKDDRDWNAHPTPFRLIGKVPNQTVTVEISPQALQRP